MSRGTAELLAFNRGRIGAEALARLDVKRTAMSAAIMTNWIPTDLGSMYLRPGWEHIGEVLQEEHRLVPFIFSATDYCLIETAGFGRLVFWVDDALLTTGTASFSITNGGFDTDLTGWTDADESACTSAWTAGAMGLTGNGTNSAIRYQQVTVTDVNEEHRISIQVTRGPVRLRIGSTATADDYFSESILGEGSHSIAFTPAGNFYIQFANREKYQTLVSAVSVPTASSDVSVTAPWAEADLDSVRWVQSGDVLFFAWGGQQYKLERRPNNSWSMVKYQPTDGPFRVENLGPITIASSALSGEVTLTASKPLFRVDQVDGLWSLNSIGQTVTAAIVADNSFSNSIEVSGVGAAGRGFGIVVSGTFSATVNLQRSFDNLTWSDVDSPYSWTAPATTGYYDELENQIVYYRIGVKTGNFTSGQVDVTLTYSSGSIRGVVRLTEFSSSTSVTAVVLSDLGGTAATTRWAEGAWSDYRGWPTAVAIHDGRLFWAGKDKVYGSVTDAFDSFDPDYEGDAGPIQRSIGFGTVDTINWLLSLNRMAAGTGSGEVTFRSSSFDEPLTPTNFTPKETGTQGSTTVQAVKVDGRGIFVQRCGSRLYQMAYDVAQNDFSLDDLSTFVPDIGSPGIVRIAVQRQPDTRIHCVRSDGTVALLLFNKAENIMAWVDIETDGEVVDVAILPGTDEDTVYYSVLRTADNLATTRLEKWAKRSETKGAAVTKLADGFVYEAASSTTMTGLDHLEGNEVVLWGNGKDQGAATVSGGSVTFPEACTNRCVGLPYTAQFKSSKLAYMAPQGTSALGAKKRVDRLGVVLAHTHYQGLQYGPDFDHLDDLPLMEGYAEVASDTVHEDFEGPLFEFPGEWMTDARLCLQAAAPRPCTVLAAVVDMRTNPK